MKTLFEIFDKHPNESALLGFFIFVVSVVICVTAFNIAVTYAAINAGLVEKQKLGTSGTYWIKPD